MDLEQALRTAQADALRWERRYHDLHSSLEGVRRQAAEELRELRASEATMRLLLESVQDYAIFTLDAEGRVTSWNEGARRLKGYSAEEIIGQPVHRFYLPEDLAAGKPEQEMATALSTGQRERESHCTWPYMGGKKGTHDRTADRGG